MVLRRPLALALLMLGVVTDDHDLALTLDNLAFFAHFLNRRSDFHNVPSFSVGYVSDSVGYCLFRAPSDAALGQVIG